MNVSDLLTRRPAQVHTYEPEELLCSRINGRFLVVSPVDRQEKLSHADPPTRPNRGEAARSKLEDSTIPLEGNVYDDAVARELVNKVGDIVTEDTHLIVRNVDPHVLRRLSPHLVKVHLRAVDGEVMRERRSPLVNVGLLQVLLGLGADRITHLLGLRLECLAKVAASEEHVIHNNEDTSVRRW